jgi:2-dehydropantoate 2-reductase
MLSIGEFPRTESPRAALIVVAFRESGIGARSVADLVNERWRKLVWNIPFSGLAVAEGGLTANKIHGDPCFTRAAGR